MGQQEQNSCLGRMTWKTGFVLRGWLKLQIESGDKFPDFILIFDTRCNIVNKFFILIIITIHGHTC